MLLGHQPSVGIAVDSQVTSFPRPANLIQLPEVVLYTDPDYEGDSHRTNLNYKMLGRMLNDRISSIVAVRGTWRFYLDSHYKGEYWDLPVGYYPHIDLLNDRISSFQCISWDEFTKI